MAARQPDAPVVIEREVTGSDRLWLGLAAAVVVAGLWLQLQALRMSWTRGGDPWLQADWLINLAAGPVRRGPAGEALLWLAAMLQIPPLLLVVVLQAALAVGLSATVLVLIARQRQAAMALAVLSPGFFALVWGVDPISALRKEMIGLLALSVLALPGLTAGRATASALLLAAGSWGHQINVLLAPAWLIALHIFGGGLTSRQRLGVAAIALVPAGSALVYAVSYARLVDAGPVCAAARAPAPLAADFCAGAIDWLADPVNGPARVGQALQRSLTAYLLPLAWAMAAVPLIRLWRLSPRPPVPGWWLVAAALPCVLLYPVGLDWGRWLATQVSTVSILILGLGAQRRFVPEESFRTPELVLWLALALAMGVAHDPVIIPFGFLLRF